MPGSRCSHLREWVYALGVQPRSPRWAGGGGGGGAGGAGQAEVAKITDPSGQVCVAGASGGGGAGGAGAAAGIGSAPRELKL